MLTTLTSACRAALPIVALLVTAASHASYMVINDDLYPTSYMAESRSRAMEEMNSDKYKISFIKGSSRLSPMARSYLDELVSRMRNASQIRIMGRMDGATVAENRKKRQVGTARASAIRAYLISQGISAQVLEVEVEAVGNPDAANGFSLSDVVVMHPRPVHSASEERATPRHYRYLTNEGTASAPVSLAAPAATAPQPASFGNDEAMLRYINQAVQSGQMAPSVAVQIIRSMLEAKGSSTTIATTPVTPTAIIRTAYVPQEAPPTRVERWTLDAGKNLKENFDAWTFASGWKPTVWEASNFYQVTSSAVLDGTFPDILKRIADSTGLNICAYPRDKYVRVTNPNVPCDK